MTEAPKMTAAEKRKERALKIKEANRLRLAKLTAAKEERKNARAAKKPDAAKEAEKKAKAEKQKVERAAKEKAVADATKALAPIAKEVNVRLEKAAKMEKDADDHRLAAALNLKDAEDKCKVAGIAFKAWSVEHVKGQSFETVRKLLAVGKADEPMLALQDMRAKNAAANRKLREKQRSEREERQTQPSAPARSSSSSTPAREESDDAALEGMDAIKEAFGELKASEQMEFAEWVAGEVGARLDMGL